MLSPQPTTVHGFHNITIQKGYSEMRCFFKINYACLDFSLYYEFVTMSFSLIPVQLIFVANIHVHATCLGE